MGANTARRKCIVVDRKNYAEFVASNPCRHTVRKGLLLDLRREPPQGFIAGVVPMLVVEKNGNGRGLLSNALVHPEVRYQPRRLSRQSHERPARQGSEVQQEHRLELESRQRPPGSRLLQGHAVLAYPVAFKWRALVARHFFPASLEILDFRSSITRSGIKIAVTGPQASSRLWP